MTSAVALSLDPHAAWYLSRGSGIVAFALLTLSLVFGLLYSGKTRYPTPAWTIAVHRHVSLLALTATVGHVAVLLFDKWMQPSVADLLIPLHGEYRPVAVVFGQVGLYLLVLAELSGFVRGKVSARTWHLVHLAAVPAWVAALVHYLAAGTDTGSAAGFAGAGVATAVLFAAAAWRLGAAAGRSGRRRPRSSAPTSTAPPEQHPVTPDAAEVADRIAALQARRAAR